MGTLEFVLVLVSIIIGLAMAELFGGVARVLRGDLRPYWIHSVWVLFVLLLQVQSWWSAWGVPVSESLQFREFSTLLIQPRLQFGVFIGQRLIGFDGGGLAVATPRRFNFFRLYSPSCRVFFERCLICFVAFLFRRTFIPRFWW